MCVEEYECACSAAPPACLYEEGGGGPLLLDNHVSLEESLAERLCTAAGCGLLVPPYFPLRPSCTTTTTTTPTLPPPPPAALSCPHSTMVTVARQLPPYSASVLGNWPVAQWSAFARSSQLRRLLPPHVSAQLPPLHPPHTHLLLAPVARQHL